MLGTFTWWGAPSREGLSQLLQVSSVHGAVRSNRDVQDHVGLLSFMVSLQTVYLEKKNVRIFLSCDNTTAVALNNLHTYMFTTPFFQIGKVLYCCHTIFSVSYDRRRVPW
jgi:hypothetical protein